MPAEDFKPAQGQNQNQDQNQSPPNDGSEGVTGTPPNTPSGVTSTYEGYDGAPSDIEGDATGVNVTDVGAGNIDTDVTNEQDGDEENIGDVDLDDEDEDLNDDDTVRQDGALG